METMKAPSYIVLHKILYHSWMYTHTHAKTVLRSYYTNYSVCTYYLLCPYQ